jgi:hypothetical protein
MDHFNKIKEACLNDEIPNIIWFEKVQFLLEELETIKRVNKISVTKYGKTVKGKEKRLLAQRKYYHRQKAKRELLKEAEIKEAQIN